MNLRSDGLLDRGLFSETVTMKTDLPWPKATDFGPGRIAKALYILSSAITFSILYVSSKRELPPTDLPIPTIVLVVTFAFAVMAIGGILGGVLSRFHKKKEQRKRDARAEEFLGLAKTNRAPGFSLYLRAFETTGRMPREAAGQMMPGLDPRIDSDRNTDFEAELAEAVEKDTPMVALGKPGEQIGAGRAASSESRWQNDIATLGSSAIVIFMLPSTRPGTLWEADFLLSNSLLNRTVFATPPRKSRWIFLPRNRDDYDWEENWVTVRRAMSERKIEFPEYDENGQFFSIGKDGCVSARTCLRGHTTALGIRGFLSDHLKAMTLNREANST